jgi:hypothetical protein
VRYAVSIPNFGAGLDAERVARLAAGAETAGWDGFFLWDHVFAWGPDVDLVDPWIALTVAATVTNRIRLGTMVTPLPRRRPLTVARQSVAIDRLSAGRFVLGVGTGAMPYEWDYCGEQTDPRIRGDMLDEALDLLTAVWTGEAVRHEGRHYRLAGTPGTPEAGWKGQCHPPPVQQPRIPIWVGGTWVPERPGGRPMRRAARWDAAVPMRGDGRWQVEDTAAVRRFLANDAAGTGTPDLVVPGETEPGVSGPVHQAHERAGATWWTESVHPWRFGLGPEAEPAVDRMAERIAAGP